MTEEEKKDLEKFNKEVIDFFVKDYNGLQADPLFQNFNRKIEEGDKETMFASQMGANVATRDFQEKYQMKIINKYCK